MRRLRTSVLGLASAGLAAGSLLGPTLAHADDVEDVVEVDSIDNLSSAVDEPCLPGSTVRLVSAIPALSADVVVRCDVTIDLNSQELSVQSIVIAHRTLEIRDDAGGGILTADARDTTVPGISNHAGARLIVHSGTINAYGGTNAAGIGPRRNLDAGSFTMHGGRVYAQGGSSGSGIGSAAVWAVDQHSGGHGGDILITDGVVEAIGGAELTLDPAGVGLGGVRGANIRITGGVVNATGGEGPYWGTGLAGDAVIEGGMVTATGSGGPGIGRGSTVVIGEGAVVTASAPEPSSAIGLNPADFWLPDRDRSLEVSGDLYLPSGQWQLRDAVEVQVTESGRILGGEEDPTVGARITGEGEIDNGGVIALDESLVFAEDATVTGHHHVVHFDTDGGTPEPDPVTLFAPSFDTGFRAFPADPHKAGVGFLAWTSQPDGAGVVVDEASTFDSDSTGPPVEHTIYAAYGDYTLNTGVTDDTTSFTAGDSATLTPRLMLDGETVPTDPAGWSLTEPTGALTAERDPDSGEITVTGTRAGTYSLTITYHDGHTNYPAELTVTIEPAAPATLDLHPSATRVDEGDTISIEVSGADAYGNDLGDLTDAVVFSSDIDTDLIDGDTITFPTASPHTITATHPDTGTTAQVVIHVNPTATPTPTITPTAPPTAPPTQTPDDSLPDTGPPLAPLWWALLATTMVGIGAWLTHARPTQRSGGGRSAPR